MLLSLIFISFSQLLHAVVLLIILYLFVKISANVLKSDPSKSTLKKTYSIPAQLLHNHHIVSGHFNHFQCKGI